MLCSKKNLIYLDSLGSLNSHCRNTFDVIKRCTIYWITVCYLSDNKLRHNDGLDNFREICILVYAGVQVDIIRIRNILLTGSPNGILSCDLAIGADFVHEIAVSRTISLKKCSHIVHICAVIILW